MPTPEAAVDILVNQPEVVQKLQVRLRPTGKSIDAPLDSQTPVRTFTTREGNSFILENAVRVHVAHLNGDGSVEVGIEPVCLQTMDVLGFSPVRVAQEVVEFGQNRRMKVWKVKPQNKKVVFAISQPRQIFDEYKQQTAGHHSHGKEGAF